MRVSTTLERGRLRELVPGGGSAGRFAKTREPDLIAGIFAGPPEHVQAAAVVEPARQYEEVIGEPVDIADRRFVESAKPL